MQQLQPEPHREVINNDQGEDSRQDMGGASAADDQDQLINQECNDQDVQRAHEGELWQRLRKLRKKRRHESDQNRTSNTYLIAGGKGCDSSAAGVMLLP